MRQKKLARAKRGEVDDSSRSVKSQDHAGAIHRSSENDPFTSTESNDGLFDDLEADAFLQSTLLDVIESFELGAPEDEQEKEADRIADLVVNDPSGKPDETPSSGDSSYVPRKAVAKSGAATKTLLPTTTVPQVSNGGSPLPSLTREYFESQMDRDFDGVRVHTGPDAENSAKQLQAKAFTIGKDIFFADNQYSPDSSPGKRLLAHELAHVGQQDAGGSAKIQRQSDEDNQERFDEFIRWGLVVTRMVNRPPDSPGPGYLAIQHRVKIRALRTRLWPAPKRGMYALPPQEAK